MRYTMTFDEDLYLLIQSRSRYNKRSLNKEIIYLIESALAAESGDNLEIFRALFAAQGGVEALLNGQRE